VESSVFELGFDWIPLTLAVLLVLLGAYRLARRDSQARGFLILGGGGIALFALWEITTIQDRVLAAAADTLPGVDPARARQLLEKAVSDGRLRISVNVGVYLVLVGGLLALAAVALCFVPGRRAAFATATPPPPPPIGAMPQGQEVSKSSAPIHPAGEHCTACKAILADESNVCWYCGRLWAPAPTASP
jgi:hypothetical protein